jgi:hypothetical protein
MTTLDENMMTRTAINQVKIPAENISADNTQLKQTGGQDK